MNAGSYACSTNGPRHSRSLRLRLLAGVLLVLVRVASADDLARAMPAGAVDLQVNLGFSDTIPLGKFSPVTVTVRNQGTALTGRLEVLAADGDPVLGGRFSTTHSRRIELPEGSRKRFRFTVYFENFAQPLMVRVIAGERVVAERSLDLRPRVTVARLLLVLSRDADLDTLNDPRGGGLRVLYPHPELLPDRWQGYDGVAAMVVHGVSLERLDTNQFAALRTWVTRGGILAVSGGPDYSLLGTPRLAELLPGVPVGQVRIAHGAGVDAALATLPLGSGTVDVNRVTAFTGRVLLGDAALPLVIERPVGQGKVVYLTFDVAREPFRRWTGMPQLWLDLLRLPPVESLASRLAERPQDFPLGEFVVDAAQPFPARAPLLLFLALYLGVLVIGHRRPGDSPRGGWRLAAMTWFTPLVFALCAHLVFGRLLFPKQASSFVAGVIQPHAQGETADLDLHLGWYANHRTDLRLEYEGVAPTFRPARDAQPRGRAADDWVVTDRPRGALQAVSRRGYELHVVEGADVISFDLRAQARLTASGLAVTVHNRSGRTIADAWLVFRGSAYALGTLAPESEWSRTLDRAADGIEYGNESWFEVLHWSGAGAVVHGVSDGTRLARAMLAARSEPGPPPDQALLVGQVRSPLRLVGASAAWQRRELVLLLARLPVAFSEHGRRGR